MHTLTHPTQPHHGEHDRLALVVRIVLLLLAAFLLVLATPKRTYPQQAAAAPVLAARRPTPAESAAVVRHDSTRAPGAEVALPDVTVHGEVRSRSELDRLAADAPSDAFTYLRTRVGVTVDAGEGARVKVTMQDSRVLGAEAHAATPAARSLDLHEGYLELVRPWRTAQLALRAGRQEVAFGNERLVGAVNWSNTGRSFDALRLTITPRDAARATWSASLFGATMDERGRRFGDPTASGDDASDHLVLGAHAAWGGANAPLLLDATLVQDVAGAYRTFVDVDRTTLDVRLRAPRLAGIRAELEGAVQAGRQRRLSPDAMGPATAQDVRAWLVGARIGTAAAIGRLTSATLGVDVLSGDRDATDGTYGAFNTLYATNHPFYGLMDLFGDPAARTRDRGLTDVFGSAVLRVSPAVSVRADVHRFALATGGDRALGWELDLVAPVRLTRNAGVELGYGIFRAADGAVPIGPPSGECGYLQLRVGF